MRFSARHLPAVLLAIMSLAVSLFAQSTTKQTAKTTLGGSISGRVTIKEKGVAGVVVGLRRSEMPMPFEQPAQRATTDQDGFYRITNVPPGGYEVTPSAPAYVMADAKDLRSKPVLVGEDENVESINFSLVRGGVITGRITDADGRPVIQQQVNIYQASAFDQSTPQRPAFSVAAGQTDDRGIYRVFGLNPGRYKVAAGRSEEGFNPYGPARSIYKQVFHPDVTDQTRATVIEVSEGSEANNVDITLGRALQTFSVSGRVVDEKGLPVPNMRFGLQRSMGQRVEFVNALAMSNGMGDFIVEGLISGKYGIYLLPNMSNDMRAETLSFDIIDQDLSGVVVRLTKGASLAGVVVIETEDKAILAKLSELQLRAFVPQTSSGAPFASAATSPIAPDGGFRLTGLPGGTVSLMLGAVNMPWPPKGLVISRIERDGIVATRGVEIKDGEQLTGVRVILSYGSAVIRGIVKLENGTLPEGGRFFIRLTKPGEPLSNFRPPQVDARGRFLIEGLPAGNYEIIASISGTPPMQPRSVRKEIVVQDGMTNEVTITIDMNVPPIRQP